MREGLYDEACHASQEFVMSSLWIISATHCLQMAERGIGFVGDITSIQPDLITTLVEGGYIPVVASVAADYDGQALNVNADIAAGEVRSPYASGRVAMPEQHLARLTHSSSGQVGSRDIQAKYIC